MPMWLFSRHLFLSGAFRAGSVEKLCLHARNMASTYVRCIPGEEKMQITVEYGHEGGSERAYNLDRKQTEEVGVALARLKANVAKNLSKKKKKKKNVAAGTVDNDIENSLNIVIIHSNGRKVEETSPNRTAWANGNTLRIGATNIPISVNAPTVKLLPLPSSIMAGFPIFPRFELEFADLQYCTFRWEREAASPQEEVAGAEGGAKGDSASGSGSVLVCSDHIYTPVTSDIGFRLKLTCVPGRSGCMGRDDCVISDEVKPGPGLCPFETRHLFTSHRTDSNSFRVVSYNMLADTYADSEYAREVLFSYCPPYALDMDYRRQLLLKEITGYHADILCLQEVDRKIFENELLPSLDLLQYTGSLKIKGQGAEGIALFVHNEKFRTVKQDDIVLTELLLEDPLCSDLKAAVEKVPALKTKLEERTTVLQTSVLETVEKPQRLLCVANTHLYFHPEAGHIRLLHAAVVLRHLNRVCQQYKQQGKEVSIVFCGDFNSTPQHGVNQLMTTKFVPHDYYDWDDGGPEEKVEGVELRHDFDLISGCGYLDYTNYTPGFNGMLDYIFADSKRLSVKQVVPPPTHEEVTLHTAIPSVVFPSDHIAQICDFTWT